MTRSTIDALRDMLRRVLEHVARIEPYAPPHLADEDLCLEAMAMLTRTPGRPGGDRIDLDMEILTRRHAAGESAETIARDLGVSATTIRSRLARWRKTSTK